MLVYFLLLIICIYSLLLYRRYGNNIFRVIPYFAMSFVCGFRGNVGIDTKYYISYFSRIVSGYDSFELGYDLLVKIVAYIGGTQQLVFLIVSALTSYFIYKFIDDAQTEFELSTLIYLCIGPYYFSSYNTIREALAVAIFLYSLRFLGEQPQYFKYIIGIVMASMFHTSALLWLAYPIFKVISKRVPTYIIIITGIVCVYLVNKYDFIKYVILKYAGQYRNYIGSSQRVQDMDNSYVFFCLIAIIIIIFATSRMIVIEQKYIDMTIISTFLIAIPLIMGVYTMIFTRLASYVTPVFVVIIPQFKRLIKQKTLFDLVIILFCIIYYVTLLSSNDDMRNYMFSFRLFN